MPTLAVTGCSYSDHTWVDKVYGEYAAEEIGYTYLHLARGIGSNHRGVLAITKAITEKKLVAGDIVVFQYTDQHRKILPCIEPIDQDERHGLKGSPELWHTEYGEGWTTDYKSGSNVWQGEGYVGKKNTYLHQALENYAVNPNFETEQMMLHNTLLEALCKINNIYLVPLLNRFVDIDLDDITEWGDDTVRGNIRNRMDPSIANKCIEENVVIKVGHKDNPSEDDLAYDAPNNAGEYDGSHLSAAGHKKLGLYLAKHLKAHKLLI